MRIDKEKAFELRRQGKSYNEIFNQLEIPKSTMHYWFRDLGWSQNTKNKLSRSDRRRFNIAAAQKQRWELWRQEYRDEAQKQFPKLKNNLLFLAGIMLYWGEGDHGKRGGQVRLVNTDPRMIGIFSRFLQEICEVPTLKIRPALFLYKDIDETKAKSFWSQAAGLPVIQFYKTQVLIG